jgi:glycosyltransferase involved in cell wall biosynthesis
MGVRVLAVIPGRPESSSMIFARRQVAALAGFGVEARTFFLTSRTNPAVMVREWVRFRRELAEFRPHVVHAHFGTVTALFCALASSSRPLVITYRGSDLNPCPSMPMWRSLLGRMFSQIAALSASRIICVSEGLRRTLWSRHDVATVLPSGVDLRVFVARPRQEARARLGWPAEEKVVLFNAGREPQVKRMDLATSAVERARELVGRLRFEILDGTVDPGLVPLYMSASDCVLVTSDWEGSPCIVQEALACGLPVVSVPVGDVPTLLDGVTPSRIAERTPEALGQAMAEILSSPVRSNGAAKARSLSVESVTRMTCELYRAAAGAV